MTGVELRMITTEYVAQKDRITVRLLGQATQNQPIGGNSEASRVSLLGYLETGPALLEYWLRVRPTDLITRLDHSVPEKFPRTQKVNVTASFKRLTPVLGWSLSKGPLAQEDVQSTEQD